MQFIDYFIYFPSIALTLFEIIINLYSMTMAENSSKPCPLSKWSHLLKSYLSIFGDEKPSPHQVDHKDNHVQQSIAESSGPFMGDSASKPHSPLSSMFGDDESSNEPKKSALDSLFGESADSSEFSSALPALDSPVHFCRDCKHFLFHPFKCRCCLYDKEVEPTADCPSFSERSSSDIKEL